ncbi:MAG: DUF2258 domain-containing protein [Desulfurococcaceae archaeon]
MGEASSVRELSSGLIIAGAYADKIRRTLFAQLRDLVKQDKEFAREIARATAELNIVLYRILVDELKLSKGDVIRARINYSIDLKNKRIIWDYRSLKLEVFRKIPDEQVSETVSNVVASKLAKILEEFKIAPKIAEETVRLFEVSEEKYEEKPPPQLEKPPTPPAPATLSEIIGSVDLIGETIEGGLLVKFTSREGSSIGIATISPSGDELVIDAIIIHEGASRRYLARTKSKIDAYRDDPGRILPELEKVSPTEVTKEQAEKLIREKMQSLL